MLPRSRTATRPLSGIPEPVLVLGASTGRVDEVVVFLPGFLAPPAAYTHLLAPLVRPDRAVVVPRLYRSGLAALAGVPSVPEEAVRAAAVARAVRRDWRPRRLWLAGHSRGGQAAWRAAATVEPVGLVLVDPVDGAGPRPGRPLTTSRPTRWRGPALIIGAGRGGRCAPVGVNHERFAAATPGARHVVLTDLGHADVLGGPWSRLGRRLCGGTAADPVAARTRVTALIEQFLAGGRSDPGDRKPYATPG